MAGTQNVLNAMLSMAVVTGWAISSATSQHTAPREHSHHSVTVSQGKQRVAPTEAVKSYRLELTENREQDAVRSAQAKMIGSVCLSALALLVLLARKRRAVSYTAISRGRNA